MTTFDFLSLEIPYCERSCTGLHTAGLHMIHLLGISTIPGFSTSRMSGLQYRNFEVPVSEIPSAGERSKSRSPVFCSSTRRTHSDPHQPQHKTQTTKISSPTESRNTPRTRKIPFGILKRLVNHHPRHDTTRSPSSDRKSHSHMLLAALQPSVAVIDGVLRGIAQRMLVLDCAIAYDARWADYNLSRNREQKAHLTQD